MEEPDGDRLGPQSCLEIGPFLAQPIMGWGVGNPEPRPGSFNWEGLDRRIRFIESTGATPVITLAGAPDWMKGGAAGHTNWSRLNDAPLAAHDEDFARLAAAVARRYPRVHYFQVWSELKGYWDTAMNNWDVAAYTELYNDVYRALKAVNRRIEVGGPYVSMVNWGAPSAGGYPSSLVGPWGTIDQRSLDAVDYWLAHALGADFVAVDGGLAPHDNRYPTQLGAATAMFAAIDTWLRGRTNLPIWWSEWYVGTPVVRSHPRVWTALATAALIQMTTTDTRVALIWDPERSLGSHSPGLWSQTSGENGGKPTDLADVFALLTSYFPPGRAASVTGTAGTEVLRSARAYLAVNATGATVTVGAGAARVRLGPWQVTMNPSG